MLKLSSGMRQAVAITGSLKEVLDGGLIRIYSGAVPASADAALGGAILLCTLSAGGNGSPLHFEGTAPAGILSKSVSEVWMGNNSAGGTPSFFRYVLVGDAGDASSTAVRLQGTAGALGSDMLISQLPLVSGSPLSFSVFQMAVPEQ